MKNKEFDNKIKKMQDNLQIKGKVYFYIRVSTSGQNEDSQFLEIENFCKKNNLDVKDESIVKIYHEKITGTKKDRPQLQAMLKAIGQDDLLVLYKLDRLSRSYRDCITIWEDVLDKGADIHVITQPLLDTRLFPRDDLFGYFINQMMLNIFAYFAQQETELRAERAKAGVAAMKESKEYTKAYRNKNGELVEAHLKKKSTRTGNVTGRPSMKIPKNFDKIYNQYVSKELNVKQICKVYDIPRSSFYVLVDRYKQENNLKRI